MKRLLVVLTLLIIAVGLSCKGGAPPDVAYVPTPGEAATISFDVDEVGAQKHTFLVWPTEISFGDPVYIVSFEENASDETIRCTDVKSASLPHDPFPGAKIATSEGIPGEFHWQKFREPWDLLGCALRCLTVVKLQPGAKLRQAQARFEFPPLQFLDDPFWLALEDATPPEGLACRLQLNVEFGNADYALKTRAITQEIIVKPRPREERDLLADWFKKTREIKDRLRPEDPNAVLLLSDYPSEIYLAARGADDIRFGDESFNPWIFIPYGYRKPSIPNCPTTVEGWRELEASLAPSTMRDEIRLVRLQLEYYAADDGEATEQAREELLTWLDGRPAPQRATMILGLFELPMPKYAEAKLGAKRRALLAELRKRLPDDNLLK